MTGGLPSDVHQLQPPVDKDLSNTGFVHRPDGGGPFLIIPSGEDPGGFYLVNPKHYLILRSFLVLWIFCFIILPGLIFDITFWT
jgi:hypothetical protein